MSGLRPKVVN
jgi:hypothetical protein